LKGGEYYHIYLGVMHIKRGRNIGKERQGKERQDKERKRQGKGKERLGK